MPLSAYPSLDPPTRQWLLRLGRRSIASHLGGAPAFQEDDPPLGAEQARGCFVSIHTALGLLRGCIGTFETEAPLWRNVEDMAVAAASRDPRFPPLSSSELDTCILEISALTPRQPAKPEQIVIGEHGLWVTRGPFRGVLLPQVAVAYQWDRDTFLKQTCIKAGLEADAWRDGSVEIYVFTAEVFTETDRLM